MTDAAARRVGAVRAVLLAGLVVAGAGAAGAWLASTGPDAGDAAAGGPLGARAQGSPPPGARLPDLRVLEPSGLYIVDGRPEGSVRLKFTTVIWNAGDGPMEVRGSPNDDGGELEVVQYLHTDDGEVRPDRPVGTLDFEHRHGHLHLLAFARYALWSLDAEGRPEERVAENAKVGFCLMDNLVVDEARAPEDPVYGGCEAEVQGISVGYGDEYLAQLFEQDLEIGHLADGRYRLVNEANPEGVLREATLDNNTNSVDVVLEGTTVRTADGAASGP